MTLHAKLALRRLDWIVPAWPAPANVHALMTTRNGGVFPVERVRQIVDGTGPAAHGNRDMPVWGTLFKRLQVGGAGAQDRIDAVVRYLQGIQERPAE